MCVDYGVDKSFRTKEKLLLTRTPVPTSTNKSFLDIERFDIAEKYKDSGKTTQNEIKNTKNKNLKILIVLFQNFIIIKFSSIECSSSNSTVFLALPTWPT